MLRSTRSVWSVVIGLALIVQMVLPNSATAVKPEEPGNGNDFVPVTLCHKLGNGSYNTITVSTEGSLNGHEGHDGDIIPAPENGCPTGEVPSGQTGSDLAITKTVVDASHTEGDVFDYTLTVTNNGPDEATGVTATDLLPSGLTFISASPSGVYDDTTGTWTVGDMANGASSTLTLTVKVNAGTVGNSIVNTVSVPTSNDPKTDNNEATATIRIITPPCHSGPTWADAVTLSHQGTRKDGSPVLAERSDATVTEGAVDGNFFSLGVNGDITLSFNQYVMDVPENDVSIHEVTFGREDYPEEKATVEVSQDGMTWFTVGTASSKSTDGISYVNFHSTGLPWIKYVRLTDATDFSPHTDFADGFDLDAVDATFGACAAVQLSKSGSYNNATGIVSFSIDWSVIGEGSVSPLVISDPLPAGLTFVSADDGGTLSSGVVTWNMGSRPAGASGMVSFTATLNAANMWTATVVEHHQGTRKDGSTVLASRSDPTQALGAPQSTGVPMDSSSLEGSFFSLGFNPQGDGGSITLGFAAPVIDLSGPDLQIFETTYGPYFYSDEKTRVEVSADNASWTSLGVITQDSTADLSVGSVTTANYIRLTDVSDQSLFEDTADGYDVDAVKALHFVPLVCSIPNVATASWSVSGTVLEVSAHTELSINPNTCDTPTGSIAGMKYNDVNGNGSKDEGDTGLAGWTIYIDSNDNGSRDGNEPFVITDNSGSYTFAGLQPGMYVVREVGQNGWTQVTPDSDHQFKYVVSVSGTAVTGKDFGNHATEGGGCSEGCGGGSGSGADLKVEKTVDKSAPAANDPIVYTVKVSNLGPLDATSVALSDVLPAAITYASSSATVGTYDSGTGVWTIGALANGANATLTINGTVKNTAVAGQNITNTATVTAAESDPDLSNNTASATSTIPTQGGGGGGGGGCLTDCGGTPTTSVGSGGANGGGGGSIPTPEGRVLGVTSPAVDPGQVSTPEVLDASILPRTGLPASMAVLLLGLLLAPFLFRARNPKAEK